MPPENRKETVNKESLILLGCLFTMLFGIITLVYNLYNYLT